ncbi:MAG TPA: response regulator [Bryobacteraceae bacterium]|nr:response regulator [Bryobacteraceae bacterium]
MPEIHKIPVILADSDALRRDGLKAVLQANGEIEVVAGCADGQTTIDTIRDLRPEVAIIDLNLPGLHGIELVRRVRGEALGTKMVILAGTADDEIVREVVRAGADGYLLKNGPARHLIDAINYVRDGGQYFSPQLGRDGRDRHLLEEPPRVPAEIARRDVDVYDERRGRQSSDYSGPDRRLRPRTTDPDRFRERIREETHRDLRDRDYEIMSKMARTEGIGALLDRLDELEGRVMEMEAGEEPLPADPREWLSRELADTLGDSRYSDSRGGRGGRSQMSAREMEARLPQMIEEAVTKRFQSMAGKLQEEIEEQHVRTLETFVKNIQTKLVQRVSVLEQNMSQQAEAMQQLREYNQRTEDNLSRLLSGVDKLATELPKRLAAAQAEAAAEPAESSREETPRETKKEREKEKKAARGPVKNLGPKIFWAVMGLAIAGGVVYEVHFKPADDDAAVVTSPDGTPAKTKAKAAPPSANADTKTKMEAAKQYADRKEYQTAEDIYKQVVQAEPNNEEAIKALASVQYREGKIEDSAATLDRLQKR